MLVITAACSPCSRSCGPELDLDIVTLGESAVDALLEAVGNEPTDPVLVKAVLDLADGMHIGERYDAMPTLRR